MTRPMRLQGLQLLAPPLGHCPGPRAPAAPTHPLRPESCRYCLPSQWANGQPLILLGGTLKLVEILFLQACPKRLKHVFTSE